MNEVLHKALSKVGVYTMRFQSPKYYSFTVYYNTQLAT